ncbi:MAG: dihydrofolate reductase [Verrucomicrobiota bacterium]
MPAASPSRPWKAIAAMARNRVIGHQGGIPWDLPEDFKWVKQCTRGEAIAMGRKTYESMGGPLPKRQNIVITRSATEIPGCVVLPSLEALEGFTAEGEVWIFGGAEIYRQAMDRVHTLYLTLVKMEPAGDTFFPPFEDQFTLAEVLRDTPEFEIRRYEAKG